MLCFVRMILLLCWTLLYRAGRNRIANVFVYALVERYREIACSFVSLLPRARRGDRDEQTMAPPNVQEELSAHSRQQNIHIIIRLLYNKYNYVK